MGSEKTELLGVCQPHDRFLLFLSNRLMLIINSGIDLISLDPFGYSWFHSPSIHGFRPIIFHQTLEVLRFAPTERGSTILVYMPRAPRRMKGQVLMIFCQNPKSYWISVYVVFSKWCSYQVAKKSCHQNFSHFEFWSHRSSPCGFGVFDAHFPWLADQLMLSRCGLWQAWIPRPYSFNQFNPSLRWSTRIFSTILRCVFEVYSLCKASLALGATCCAWSAEPSIAAFFGSEIQSQLIEPTPIHHIVCGNFRTSSSCQVGVFLFLTASPADFNKTIRDCPKSLSCQTNWAVFEPPVDD